MVPASATWPEAVTIELLDSTRPLLIPIATLAPLPHTELDRGDLNIPLAIKTRRRGRRRDMGRGH